MSTDYKAKYLKYKIKYISIKETNLYGGNDPVKQKEIDVFTRQFITLLSNYKNASNGKIKIDVMKSYELYQSWYPNELTNSLNNKITNPDSRYTIAEPIENATLMAQSLHKLMQQSTTYKKEITDANNYNKYFKATPLETIIINVLTLAK